MNGYQRELELKHRVIRRDSDAPLAGGGRDGGRRARAALRSMQDAVTRAHRRVLLQSRRRAATLAAVGLGLLALVPPLAAQPLPMETVLFDGMNDRLRILLWLVLSAALSWAATFYLFRRRLNRAPGDTRRAATSAAHGARSARRAWLPRVTAAVGRLHALRGALTGQRRAIDRVADTPVLPGTIAATDPRTLPVASTSLPAGRRTARRYAPTDDVVAPPEASDASVELLGAASHLAQALEHFSSRLNRHAVSPGTREPGLFEPVAGIADDVVDADMDTEMEEDALSDVEPIGLFELESARRIRQSGRGEVPAAPEGHGADRHAPRSERTAASERRIHRDAELLFDDEFFEEEGLTASPWDEGAATLDALEGRDELPPIEAYEDDLPPVDDIEELLASAEHRHRTHRGVGSRRQDPFARPARARRRSPTAPGAPPRPLGLAEISELVALGLGDSELIAGDGA